MSICKNKKHIKKLFLGELICQSGCDCHRARELHRLDAEDKTGVKYDEEFFKLYGISLTPSGYEQPYIIANINGKQFQLNKSDIEVLQGALHTAANWCENGWCPGSC